MPGERRDWSLEFGVPYRVRVLHIVLWSIHPDEVCHSMSYVLRASIMMVMILWLLLIYQHVFREVPARLSYFGC